jgi:hypothetical protein
VLVPHAPPPLPIEFAGKAEELELAMLKASLRDYEKKAGGKGSKDTPAKVCVLPRRFNALQEEEPAVEGWTKPCVL